MASLGTAYIKIAPDLTGVQSKVAKSFAGAGYEVAEKINKPIMSSFDKGMKSLVNIGNFGLKTLKVAGIAAGVAIAANVGKAIKRIDTLVAFPRVLQAMGISANEAQIATDKLALKLKGLPTSLQAGAEGIQAFVVSGLDINKATDGFLAFNNAILASSTDAGRAEAALDMLNKALSRGKFTAQEWDSVATAMPYAMKALQKETGMTAHELREFYKESPDQLIADLTRLNNSGTGDMKSLEDAARDATGGIGTAWENLSNRITAGIAEMVKAIGGGDLEKGQRMISDAINALGDAFGNALKVGGEFIAFLVKNKEIVAPVAAVFGTLVGTITALVAIQKTAAIITGAYSTAMGILAVVKGGLAVTTGAATAALTAFNIALKANPIGLIITAVVALIGALIWFFTETELGKEIFANVMKFIGEAIANVVKFFTEAWANIQNTWAAVAGFFTGVWNGISSAFANVGAYFKSKFSSGLEAILAIFTPYGMIKIGADIIGGIVKGLTPAPIINKMKEIAKGAMDAVKSFFGIKSPSRVMRDQVGKQLIAGLGLGMEDEEATLINQAKGISGNLLGAMNTNATFTSGLTSGTGRGDATIEQTNNVYTELDMNVVNRNLMWEFNRT